ncbi:MAG: hypothetical protein RMJ43_09935 [Chloroherpetonaceae bacterium]|nr:hypothetical protein [Chloroherpetonaceae bacterium]
MTPPSGGRTALPVELLSGSQATTPTTGAPAPRDGLAEGVTLPPVAPGSTGPRVPELGTFTPAKSKYYPGQVVDPVSGTHYDAETGQVTSAPAATGEAAGATRTGKDIEIVWDEPQPTMWHLVARYAGVFAILLALGVLAVTQNPGSFPIALLLTNFIAGMLLPVMRVVPWQDEDSDDVFLMLVLTVAFGPVVSLIFYSVLTALRQDGNPAIVGVLAVSMLTRVGLGLAAGNIQSWWHLMPFPAQGFTVGMMLINWAGLIALAGWYFGNVFHKFDE